MRVLLVLLLCGSVSACLVTDGDSGSKKLRTGYNPADKEKMRKKAASVIGKLCGKSLKKRHWVEHKEVLYTEYFFIAEAKAKRCDNQVVAIGTTAAHLMKEKGITCAIEHDEINFKFEVPGDVPVSISPNCNTKYIDVRADNNVLYITSLDYNGRLHLARIGSVSEWKLGGRYNIELIEKGLPKRVLNDALNKHYYNEIVKAYPSEQAMLEDEALDDMDDFMSEEYDVIINKFLTDGIFNPIINAIKGKGNNIMESQIFDLVNFIDKASKVDVIASSEAATTLIGSVPRLAAVPTLAAAPTIGITIYNHLKANSTGKKYKEARDAALFLIRNSVGKMVAGYEKKQ